MKFSIKKRGKGVDIDIDDHAVNIDIHDEERGLDIEAGATWEDLYFAAQKVMNKLDELDGDKFRPLAVSGPARDFVEPKPN